MDIVKIVLLVFAFAVVFGGVYSMMYSREEQSNRESSIYNYASRFTVISGLCIILYVIFKR